MRRHIRSIAMSFCLLVGSSACKSQPEAVCEAFCECTECTDTQRSDCETRIDHLMTTADDADCGRPREALFDCLEQHVECRHGGVEASCGTQKEGLERCLGAAICIEPYGGFCADSPAGE